METSSKSMEDEYSSDECESGVEDEREKVSLAYKMKCVKMAKAHPGWSLKTLQRQGCSLLREIEWLPRWEAECKKGRGRICKRSKNHTHDKYRIINEWTWDNVVRARQRKLEIKGRHIRQWALAVAAQYPDLRFGASPKWLQSFKEKYQFYLRPPPSSINSNLAE